MQMKNRAKPSGAAWLSVAAVILIGLFYGAVSIIYAALGSTEPVALLLSYLHKPGLVVLNALPSLVLCVLVWLLSGRVWVAALLSGGVTVFLGCVNYLKLLFRGDPLIAKDVFVFMEAATAGEGYSGFLRPAVILGVVLVIVVTALSLLVHYKLPSRRNRLLSALVCAIVAVAIYFGVYASDAIYEKTENIERNIWFMSRWSDTDQYVSRGFSYPLLHSLTDISDPAPDNYDKAMAQKELREIGDSDIPEDKKVNVVAVMIEAFTDFSDFGLEFETDPYVNFHRLESEGVSGRLVTNIFAGGTVDTERAFLTGINKLYDYRSDAGSYVRYFNDQGYTTEGGHPCYGWFYNRQNVNGYLGFGDYWFYETRYNDPGETTYSGMMIDRAFYDDLLGMFDAATATGNPYFQFSVTYQNHGPYEEQERYFSSEYLAKTPELSDAGYNIVNNYLSGMAQADAAAGYLAAELARRDEPVVLVLFGDHKPWLGNGSFVYSELGIDISCSDEESFLNYYSTPYVIWANDAAKQVLGNDFMGDGGDISPNYLMNKVFSLCSWEGPAFMKASGELMERLPVITSLGAYWENGVFTDTLSEGTRSMLEDFEKLEYYWRKNP